MEGYMDTKILKGRFDEVLAQIREMQSNIVTIPQQMQAITQSGNINHCYTGSNFVAEGVIYFPRGTPKIVRQSPILVNPTGAYRDHKQEKEFMVSPESLEQTIVESADFPQESVKIPTRSFCSDPLINFVLGEETAKIYGELLSDSKITRVLINPISSYYVRGQRGAFVRQVFFDPLGEKSFIETPRISENSTLRMLL